jgi:very-short-patch-repair endonuclease
VKRNHPQPSKSGKRKTERDISDLSGQENHGQLPSNDSSSVHPNQLQTEQDNNLTNSSVKAIDTAPNVLATNVAKQNDIVNTKRRIAWWIRQGKPNPGTPYTYVKGHVPWIKGKHGLKSLRRTGKTSRGLFKVGNKYGTLLKGIPKSEEMKRKSSLAKMGDRNPMKNPIYAKKMALSKRGKPNPKHKEYWRLHHDEQLKKMMVGEHKRPNKVELKLIDIINRHALPFKYVGNWELIVGGKCPDFLNTTGKRQLIELFGNYWHTIKARETAEERVDHLRKHGFETLILWEKELDDEPLIVDKILQFAGLA